MSTIAPTKTNLIKLRDELKFARMGYELLDQKRNILIGELLALVDQAIEYEAKVDTALAKAYAELETSILDMGRLNLSFVASGIDVRSAITLKHRRVMGVALPVVDTSFQESGPYYSLMNTSSSLDGTVSAFRTALGLLGQMAELKVSIMRLAGEVHRTIRKVNALEKIAIPQLEESMQYVQTRLEESERDMFVLMKQVKERLTQTAAERKTT